MLIKCPGLNLSMYGVSEKKRKRGRTLSKISKLSAESDLVEEEEGEGDESDAV